MEIISQHQTGLLPEHAGIGAIIRTGVRTTIPAREALLDAGAAIDGDTVKVGAVMPPGLVAVRIPGHPGPAIRLATEPAYPAEIADMWMQADWTPCPQCGAPLIWYEAGYVPGYRVCSMPPHHHSRVQ